MNLHVHVFAFSGFMITINYFESTDVIWNKYWVGISSSWYSTFVDFCILHRQQVYTLCCQWTRSIESHASRNSTWSSEYRMIYWYRSVLNRFLGFLQKHKFHSVILIDNFAKTKRGEGRKKQNFIFKISVFLNNFTRPQDNFSYRTFFLTPLPPRRGGGGEIFSLFLNVIPVALRHGSNTK